MTSKLKLVDIKTGRELGIGDKLQTQKQTVTLLGMSRPHKPESTGRVFIEFPDGTTGEYFPSVVNATWEWVKERTDERTDIKT